jgi:hypothetical protein
MCEYFIGIFANLFTVAEAELPSSKDQAFLKRFCQLIRGAGITADFLSDEQTQGEREGYPFSDLLHLSRRKGRFFFGS